MIASVVDTITKLIQSPPGQLAAGFVLAGIVWKFFERVENLLTEDTKLEIAVWLLGVRVGPRLKSWPETFLTMFNRVFGARHLSLKSFGASALISICTGLIGFAVEMSLLSASVDESGPISFADMLSGFLLMLTTPAQGSTPTQGKGLVIHFYIPLPQIPAQYVAGVLILIMVTLCFNVLPDFFSLLDTRLVLKLMNKSRSGFGLILLLVLDAVLTVGTAVLWDGMLFRLLGDADPADWWNLLGIGDEGAISAWLVYPALFTSVWLWLYAGSGFLLKAARRFDLGFDWFSRKFDIEKKPLQSIGLVAGALVAVVYWSAVMASRIVK